MEFNMDLIIIIVLVTPSPDGTDPYLAQGIPEVGLMSGHARRWAPAITNNRTLLSQINTLQ